VVLAITVITFPLLLDRDVGAVAAQITTAISARMKMTGLPAHYDTLVAKWANRCFIVTSKSSSKSREHDVDDIMLSAKQT
ncbi:hypothetical protein ACC809_37440, partial [Rhizobium johnstonii]